jgi:hypothetical protein
MHCNEAEKLNGHGLGLETKPTRWTVHRLAFVKFWNIL